MKLTSLLEIARNFRDNNVKTLHESYNNNLFSEWQNEIWSNYFASVNGWAINKKLENHGIANIAIHRYLLTSTLEKIYNTMRSDVDKAAEDL